MAHPQNSDTQSSCKCDIKSSQPQTIGRLTNASAPEEAVAKFLTNQSLNFHREYAYKGCEYLQQLYFDFYLPDHSIAIEVDGEHHFKDSVIFQDKPTVLKEVLARDGAKNDFCTARGISLLRISYRCLDLVNFILTTFIKYRIRTQAVLFWNIGDQYPYLLRPNINVVTIPLTELLKMKLPPSKAGHPWHNKCLFVLPSN
jgi:hypothetical protein